MSPVIGVVLMVGVTVVLAAVIGTFVLDLGGTALDPAPSASLAVSASPVDDRITITHRGGDVLDGSRTRVVLVNGSSGTRLTWGPTSGTVLLDVGRSANVSLGAAPAGEETIDWDGDGVVDYEEAGTGDVPGVRSGVEYTIYLVDTRSDSVYFETTVRA